MAAPDLVMYEEEYQQIKDTLQRLQVDSNSKIVFLVDKNGQQIAVQGDMRGVDATSLASLTAGNVAATDGLAKLIGEKEFSILFHEGERDNIHISLVAQRAILVVIFDEKSSLGLVRLRVKKASNELNDVFARIMAKVESEKSAAGSAFATPPARAGTSRSYRVAFGRFVPVPTIPLCIRARSRRSARPTRVAHRR